jgi:hypothetical protein
MYTPELHKKWNDLLFFASQKAKLNGVIAGEIMDFLAEIDRLRNIEDAAIKQSEEVQRNWLSPIEAKGLSDEIDRLRSQSEWVSVETRLPERDKVSNFVLCFFSDGGANWHDIACYSDVWITLDGHKYKSGWYLRQNSEPTPYKVIAWQPLPQPPSEVK